MIIEVLNIEGQKTGRTVDLPEEIFGVEPNEHAVYLAVKQYLANQRQGTHKTKGRSEIAGSTRKLHKQKGTGGSRKGDIKNPLYHGGGRMFGPQPRDYSFSLNKKVKSLARKSALSSKAANQEIVVIEDFAMQAPKTKQFLNILSKLQLAEKKSLMVTADYDVNIHMSSRNLPKATVMRATDVSTYDLLNASVLVLSESSLQKIKESFA